MYLRLTEVAKLLGVSLSNAREIVKKIGFPRARHISPGVSIWIQSEIEAYVAKLNSKESSAISIYSLSKTSCIAPDFEEEKQNQGYQKGFNVVLSQGDLNFSIDEKLNLRRLEGRSLEFIQTFDPIVVFTSSNRNALDECLGLGR